MAFHGIQLLVLLQVLYLLYGLTTIDCYRLFEGKSWNVLIFVQHYPPAVCERYKMKIGHQCGVYPKKHWTIHGLWPQLKGTYGPNYCVGTKVLDHYMLDVLKEELEEWWAPIEKHESMMSFWEHEWKKHGTCAMTAFLGQYQYFSQGLEWIKNYNAGEIFDREGIMQGMSYTVEQITDSIKAVTMTIPQIMCFRNKQGEYILLEVRICFTRANILVDCKKYTNCRGVVLYTRWSDLP